MISDNCHGTMNFFDGRIRSFEFNPMENKISWSGSDTEEMWVKGDGLTEKIHGWFDKPLKPDDNKKVTHT